MHVTICRRRVLKGMKIVAVSMSPPMTMVEPLPTPLMTTPIAAFTKNMIMMYCQFKYRSRTPTARHKCVLMTPVAFRATTSSITDSVFFNLEMSFAHKYKRISRSIVISRYVNTPKNT